MGWKLATRDSQRFKAYYPSVLLIEPQAGGVSRHEGPRIQD
jgi:hypothetical protein